MKLSALILDLDGTLIDTETLSKNAWEHAAGELGFEFSLELYASIAGRSISNARYQIKNAIEHTIDFELFMRIAHDFYINDMETNGIRVIEGAHALIDYAKQTGLAATIATSTDRKYADRKMHLSGLDRYIQAAVTGDEVKNGKPAPDLFLRAAEIIDSPADQCIVIEDSEAGINAAYAAGMTPVMVPSTIEPSDYVRQISYAVMPTLQDALKVIKSAVNRFE